MLLGYLLLGFCGWVPVAKVPVAGFWALVGPLLRFLLLGSFGCLALVWQEDGEHCAGTMRGLGGSNF